jgi:hypothetical protein
MVRDRFNPHNTITLLVVFAGLTVLLGLFYPTNWGVWMHWSWLGILWHFISIALAVFFVWGLSFEAAESAMKNSSGDRIGRSRRASYGVCVMAVLCGAVVIGFLVTSGAYAGEYIEATGETVTQDVPPWPAYKRDRLIEDTFLVALLPALFAVRCALGPKKKEN